MSFSLCLCGRESWLLSCCRIVAIVPCDFLIVSLQKKERVFFSFLLSYSRHCSVCLSRCVFAEERVGFFLAVVWSPLFRVSFSLCLCRRKRELVSFLLSYSRHCSVCLSRCVFAEERAGFFLAVV